MTRAGRIAALLLVASVAAFFRLYRIDTVPPCVFFDVAQNGVDVTEVYEGRRFPLMFEAGEDVKGRTREPLFLYMAAGMFLIVGPTVTALHLTGAVSGIATVLAFHLLCRRLFGLRIAVIAAILLAVGRWHVTLSRIGLRAILVPFFLVLSVWAAARLAERRTRARAALVGVVLGLGWYTYQAFWIAPVPLLLLLAVELARTRMRDARQWLALMPAILLAFLIVAAPIIGYAILKPDYYFARSIEVTGSLQRPETRWAELRSNLQQGLFMLHLRSGTAAQFGFNRAPMLDPITAIAFLAGLYALCKSSTRSLIPKLGAVFYWLLPLLPGAVGNMQAQPLRAVGAIPAVCLIAAFGVERIAFGAADRRRRLGAAVAAVTLLVIGAVNYRDYFERWAKSADVAQAYAVDTCRFFDFCADLAKDSDVYISPALYYTPNMRFLNVSRGADLRLLSGVEAFVAAPDDARDRVYVSDDARMNSLIEDIYPEHEVLSRYDLSGARSGRVYRVPRDKLLDSLPDSRRAEIGYWLKTMLDDFHEQHRVW
jgi:hypothetical protein